MPGAGQGDKYLEFVDPAALRRDQAFEELVQSQGGA